GTSPIVHATSMVDHPVKQGMMGAFEVFVDTIVVCSATGLLVITTGFWSSGLVGAELTLTALEANIGSFARMAIAISIFFFAMTTGTGWFVYYRTLLVHAFEGEFREKILLVQKVLNPFMGLIITCITVFGGGTPAELWVMADFSSALPTFINVFVLLILSGKVFDLIKDYKARYMGVGQVDPNFKVFYEE
ncbi:MAG: alanine:cation symporter family protein, partial [Firmicutes bacterium]|nr:alanine:cation symporter family protein [Bacillota bacterium]